MWNESEWRWAYKMHVMYLDDTMIVSKDMEEH